MVEMAEIKNDLPDWPDDVIEQWLHYFAQDCGWPPPEPLGDHRWSGLLGGKPLSWRKKVSWKKKKIKCDLPSQMMISQEMNISQECLKTQTQVRSLI
jgi:hypothetical protein